MHVNELNINNPKDHPLEVFYEPYGISFILESGETFRFVGTGEHPGQFEVERGVESVTVYAWPSSTCIIYNGDQIVMEIPIPVPGVPEGMDTRGFIHMLFGKPE